MLTLSKIKNIVSQIEKKIQYCPKTGAEIIIDHFGRDPFVLLIFCILSLRTRDETAIKAAFRLFEVAKTPKDLISLDTKTISSLIYPVGFYNRKAIQIQECAHILIEKFHGKVPDNEKDVLALPGVGRKTMNLVLQQGFLKDTFCVDTHVHRIANKLGFVHTKTPEETEFALKKLLPKSLWNKTNRSLLLWGQYICTPTKHQCSDSIEHHPIKNKKYKKIGFLS